MASHETCLGMESFKEDVSTAFGKAVDVGFLHFVVFTSRRRLLQKFICDLGMEPQSDTLTVIFKEPDIVLD